MNAEQATSKVQENQKDGGSEGGFLGQMTLPAQFGRLTLLRRLARGGMGEVYLAATRGIEGAERPCVLKTIREEHSTDKSFRARFLDETRIQAQLTHPGVAQILEATTLEDGRPYAVVEYVEGRHLGEVMQRSVQLGVSVGWADAIAIGIAFGDALAHVHERTDESGRPLGIAHRDLSPQNIMLGYAGDLKLIDFGTAKGENRRCRTVSGIVYAKPGYVAPEVAQAIPGGSSADLYAFGVMVWELAAGRRFLQGDPVDHQAKVGEGTLRLPAIASKIGAPARFDELLAELTHPDPTVRIPTARRAVSELLLLLKLAPSLADGDRSVRGRIAHLMQSLYPAEPARSRADFAKRVAEARSALASEEAKPAKTGIPEPSPIPPQSGESEGDGVLAGTRYRLEKRLSESGMGEVWEATHIDLGRKIALKILPASLATSPLLRQRFKAEARALARLSHPGLPKIHDFGIAADGRPFAAMELLTGKTLESRNHTDRPEWEEAVRIAEETLAVLQVAHDAGIIHRDISPSNIFLVEDGSVRLLDFGVSTTSAEIDEDRSREAPLSVGTPEYISPEQAAGSDPNTRSDLYALGVVLYEMLTGRLPHPLGEQGSPSLAALLTAKITVTPPAPSQFIADPSYPRALDAAVLRLLERDVEKRYASAEDTIVALGRAKNRLRPPSNRAILLSAAAAFSVVVAGGAVLMRSFPSAEPRVVSVDANEATAKVAVATPVEAGAPKVEEATQPVAEPSEPASEAKSASSVSEGEVERVLALLKRGQKIRAHHEMRSLYEKSGDDPVVLRALVQTARGVKAWGEALRAMSKVISLSPTLEDRVELARLERATLTGDPIKTLEGVLAESPDHAEAKDLLLEYRKDKRLAVR